MSISTPAALLSVAICLALPAGAFGATVSLTTVVTQEDGMKGGTFTVSRSTVTYEAGPGEANAPLLTASPDGRVVTVSDAAAPLSAGAGCAADGAGAVRCQAPPGEMLVIKIGLGDGDDVLSTFGTAKTSVTVEAGAGADVVEIEDGIARGGDGNDVLRARQRGVSLYGDGGADVILGGPGDDLVEGGSGSDRLDGAGGRDAVSWNSETLPVTVDLSTAGPAGTTAEPDDVRNFEHATGGGDDDVLRGSAAGNSLSGGGGDDLLEGGDGPDFLDGGEGADRVLGGAGRDELSNGYVAGGERDTLDGGTGGDLLRNQSAGSVMLGGAGADTLDFAAGARLADGGAGDDRLIAFELDGPTAFLRCGAGRDRVLGLEARALVPRDCESVELGTQDVDGAVVSSRVTLRGRTLRIPIASLCASLPRCPMRVAVYAGDARHALARVARTLRRPTGQSATIQLSAGAARRIALAGRVRLEFRSREALRPEAMTVRVARG